MCVRPWCKKGMLNAEIPCSKSKGKVGFRKFDQPDSRASCDSKWQLQSCSSTSAAGDVAEYRRKMLQGSSSR